MDLYVRASNEVSRWAGSLTSDDVLGVGTAMFVAGIAVCGWYKYFYRVNAPLPKDEPKPFSSINSGKARSLQGILERVSDTYPKDSPR